LSLTWNDQGEKCSRVNLIGGSGEHLWPLIRRSSALHGETSHGFVDPMTDENIENLNGAIQHSLGRRQVAEGHGGKPLTATTNSVSSHYQGMSCTASKRWRRKRKGGKHTQQSMENDQWPFCL
jgi:hypothetical protein